MTNQQSICSAVFVSLFALGCGNSTDSTGFQLRAATNAPGAPTGDLITVDDGGSAFSLSDATLNLRDIKLDLPDGVSCADVEAELADATCSSDPGGEDTIEIEGPFAVDLVAGTSSPSLDSVLIPALSYRRIDFRVDDNANDVSFAASAGFDLDGTAMTLDLSLDFTEDIRVEQTEGVAVNAESDLIAEFVVDDWLAGVDLASCIADGDVAVDGTTVTVDDDSTSGSCSDIENVIKDNMKNSGQLDRD